MDIERKQELVFSSLEGLLLGLEGVCGDGSQMRNCLTRRLVKNCIKDSIDLEELLFQVEDCYSHYSKICKD